MFRHPGLLALALASALFAQTPDSADTKKLVIPERRPVEIHLKNGRVIHADEVRDLGDKVEIESENGSYAIPKSRVSEVLSSEVVRPRSEVSMQSSSKNESPLETVPGATARTSDLGASISELRARCDQGLSRKEEMSKSDREQAEYACQIINHDMGSAYESKMNRGASLHASLCQYGGGHMPSEPVKDPKAAADLREFQELQNWLMAQMKQIGPTIGRDETPAELAEHLRALRLLVDFGRIDGACGHGW